MRYKAAFAAVVSLLAEPGNARENGFAIWNADSSVKAGSVVSVSEDAFVDLAELKPVAAIRTAAPLSNFDNGKIVLYPGAILAQMSGGLAGQYCTWNHGPSRVPDRVRTKLLSTSMGALFCVTVDPSDNTTSPNYVSGNNALLLRSSRTDFAKGPRRISSSRISTISPRLYPSDMEVGLALKSKIVSSVRKACLRWGYRVIGGSIDAFSPNDFCFNGIGDSLELEGGKYTLIEANIKMDVAKIRVDSPFKIRDFVPKVFVTYKVLVI